MILKELKELTEIFYLFIALTLIAILLETKKVFKEN